MRSWQLILSSEHFVSNSLSRYCHHNILLGLLTIVYCMYGFHRNLPLGLSLPMQLYWSAFIMKNFKLSPHIYSLSRLVNFCQTNLASDSMLYTHLYFAFECLVCSEYLQWPRRRASCPQPLANQISSGVCAKCSWWPSPPCVMWLHRGTLYASENCPRKSRKRLSGACRAWLRWAPKVVRDGVRLEPPSVVKKRSCFVAANSAAQWHPSPRSDETEAIQWVLY